MSKVVRVGIVGGGIFGQWHLKAFTQLQNEGKAELVAIADLVEEKRNKAAKEYGIVPYEDYKEMIEKENLDAITVVTPDAFHADIAITGLEMGCHVLSEKPMATTVEECRKILDISSKNPDKILMVDFHKRLDMYHVELERVIREGELGKIQYGYAYMEDRIEVSRDWFKSWPAGSSPFWFIGVHFVDLIYWVIKSKGDKVFATGRREKLKSLGLDFWDNISAQIVFKNGATFTVDAGWTLPDGFEAIVNQGIRIIGTEGIFEIDSQDRGAGACFKGKTQQSYNLGVYSEKHTPDGRIMYGGYGIESIMEFAYHVNYVLNGGNINDLKGLYADAEDGLEVSKICVGVHKSAEEGGTIIDLDTL
ncbi:MAG: Gfo/Idh/MocA family oxidoreductase [Candidatus Latescibacteria bacterium]|jgi:predicted dehydrogenase|nr:Gfo/Idh/MocA family oxidoreductase [Candidatus Latescibacterota bacterium]